MAKGGGGGGGGIQPLNKIMGWVGGGWVGWGGPPGGRGGGGGGGVSMRFTCMHAQGPQV